MNWLENSPGAGCLFQVLTGGHLLEEYEKQVLLMN